MTEKHLENKKGMGNEEEKVKLQNILSPCPVESWAV